MANALWLSSALNVAQVQSYVFAGTWGSSDVINITIGQKTASTTAGSATTATVVSNLVSFFNALDSDLYPEFKDITASASTTTFILTADNEGEPFTCTIDTTETGGGAADAQTIDGVTSSAGTATTASSSRWNWDTAKNWSTNAAPADTNDVYIDISDGSILYGLSNANTELTSLNISAKFSSDIGLPDVNENDYYEYRNTYLRVDATTVNIGYGVGQGSRRIKLDVGDTDASTVNVWRMAAPAENGVPALLLKGNNASHVLNLLQGHVGLAFYPGETATFPVIRIGSQESPATDATLVLGAGCTNTTINQYGGNVTANSAVTTWNIRGGVGQSNSGTITTLNLYNATYYHLSSGTITTVNVYPGSILDFSRDPRARTSSTINVYKGGKVLDPYKTLSGTPAITLVDCDLHEVTLQLGRGITVTRS